MSSGTVSRRTRITGSPRSDHCTASSAVNTTWPDAAPGDAGKPSGRDRNLRPLLRIEARRQQLRQRLRIDQQHGFPRRDQPFLDQVGGDHHGGVAGALAAARLQHEQPLVLDGELEVLHVLVVLLEARRDVAQLLVRLRHHLLELRIGCGVRMPATTSSPCALIRNSP